MRHQQQQTGADHTERLPAFFSALDPLQHGQMVGIQKNPLRNLKTDAVFALVAVIFILIPFKIKIHFCNYILIII